MSSGGYSPYMHLFRNDTSGGTVDNYTSLVRSCAAAAGREPAVRDDIFGLDRQNRIQQATMQRMQYNSVRSLQGVGTPQYYMNYGSYYPGFGGAGSYYGSPYNGQGYGMQLRAVAVLPRTRVRRRKREMKLVLLGTTGYHPNDRRQTPCLLLPECGVMLDAGTAIYRAGEYLAAPELDIFLTHAHLDHVVGLTYLFSVMRVHPLRRITVHGLPENLRAVEEHLFAEALFPVRPPFELRAAGGELCAARRRTADAFSAGTSRRVGRLSARLAGPLDGLRHRHDGRRRGGLRGEDPRRGSVGPRVLFPRRPGRLGAEDRPQPHHAGGRSGPAGRRRSGWCWSISIRSRPPTTRSGWTWPGRSSPTRFWARIGWSWSFRERGE